jgi:hypothetical protein
VETYTYVKSCSFLKRFSVYMQELERIFYRKESTRILYKLSFYRELFDVHVCMWTWWKWSLSWFEMIEFIGLLCCNWVLVFHFDWKDVCTRSKHRIYCAERRVDRICRLKDDCMSWWISVQVDNFYNFMGDRRMWLWVFAKKLWIETLCWVVHSVNVHHYHRRVGSLDL